MTLRVMMRTAAVGLIALLGTAMAGCAGDRGGEEPTIVVTTNILGDIVSKLAGDEAQVTTLMKPNADPHSFEISAREAAQLAEAELVVSNGLGLEEGVEQHLDTAAEAGAPQYVAGDHIEVLEYSDDASGADPHFWTDPGRVADVVESLEEEIATIDGVDAARIEENASAYLDELTALDEEMTAAFVAIPDDRRALVTNHHVFGYLAERFDFEIVGAVIPGGTTLASPSAADLESLSSAIEETGVPAIFAESSQPDRLMRVLGSEAGIDVEVVELFTESLSEPEGEAPTYLDMMRVNTERIAGGLTR